MNTRARQNTNLAVALALVTMAGGCRQFFSGQDTGLDDLLPTEAEAADDKTPAIASGEPETLKAKIAAAQSLARQDKPVEAINAYLGIVQNHRVPANVYQRLARLYHDQKQFDRSAHYYLAAVQIEPNNAELLCDCGYSRCLQWDLVEAEQFLRRALAIDPKMARAHNNLGIVLAYLGKQNEAEAEFRRAGCSRSRARENLARLLKPGEVGPAAQEKTLGHKKHEATGD